MLQYATAVQRLILKSRETVLEGDKIKVIAKIGAQRDKNRCYMS
jgi:hypothetical protein